MNSTDKDPRKLAGALFDEVIAPLAAARKAASNPPYFAAAADMTLASYYQEPIVSELQAADYQFPGGGSADGFIDALAAHWLAQGETELAAMAPRLKEIAAELKREASQGDGTISALCYTMF